MGLFINYSHTLVLDSSSNVLVTDIVIVICLQSEDTPRKSPPGYKLPGRFSSSQKVSAQMARAQSSFTLSHRSRAFQSRDIRRFTLLIKNNQARFNLSAYFACGSRCLYDEVYIILRLGGTDGLYRSDEEDFLSKLCLLF